MRDEMMHDELRIDSADADATVALGRAVGSCCVAGDVVALEGELGAGKTQFARGLAEGLGLDPLQVSSPTFVIMQEYVHKAADGIGGAPIAGMLRTPVFPMPLRPVPVGHRLSLLHGSTSRRTSSVTWAGRFSLPWTPPTIR